MLNSGPLRKHSPWATDSSDGQPSHLQLAVFSGPGQARFRTSGSLRSDSRSSIRRTHATVLTPMTLSVRLTLALTRAELRRVSDVGGGGCSACWAARSDNS